MRITGIVSGGQTGADQAGLRAAKQHHLQTGGYAPKDFMTEKGPAPWLGTMFGLVEIEGGYPERTEMNVIMSDGTVVFGRMSKGSQLTSDVARENRKPFLWLDEYQSSSAPQRLRIWVAKFNIRILNVAGNRESKSPGIGVAVEKWLVEVLPSCLE